MLSLPIPTLQERGHDVLVIADKFLREFYDMQGKSYGIFSDESARLLLDYGWPGNIRQLRNAMERLSVMTAGGLIEAQEVTRALQLQEFGTSDRGGGDARSAPETQGQHDSLASLPSPPGAEGPKFGVERAAYEKELIDAALRECDGSKSRAAKMLGISRTTLWRKLQRCNDI